MNKFNLAEWGPCVSEGEGGEWSQLIRSMMNKFEHIQGSLYSEVQVE